MINPGLSVLQTNYSLHKPGHLWLCRRNFTGLCQQCSRLQEKHHNLFTSSHSSEPPHWAPGPAGRSLGTMAGSSLGTMAGPSLGTMAGPSLGMRAGNSLGMMAGHFWGTMAAHCHSHHPVPSLYSEARGQLHACRPARVQNGEGKACVSSICLPVLSLYS